MDPHPVKVTIRDNKGHIRVLSYSIYTTITGWGGPIKQLRFARLPFPARLPTLFQDVLGFDVSVSAGRNGTTNMARCMLLRLMKTIALIWFAERPFGVVHP